MSSADATANETTSGNLLRIVAGLHAGASRDLAEREMILVGSGDDCDIVLADNGVATRHALISLVDGRFHLRALDAPLKLESRVLHPGDPVELDKLQRVGLGDAALAFGHADDPAWLALMPEGLEAAAGRRRLSVPFARRLPMIAAIAVLSLASLAIFAAVMPSGDPPVDVEARLKALAREFRVADQRIERDINGVPVLFGTIRDAAAVARMREQIESEGLDASLKLRTGRDLAVNVAEVLRAGGFPAKTRYLGNSDVEATGHFEDMNAFANFVRSRAIIDTGVRRVVPINLADPLPDSDDAAGDDVEKVRIAAIVRGDEPHVIDADGRRYVAGDEVPGWGSLSVIGKHALVLGRDGQLHRLVPQPAVPAPAPEDATDAAAGDRAEPAAARPKSSAHAAEQARAAGRRM